MRLLAAIVASPADLLISQGVTVRPTKSTAPNRWLRSWPTPPPACGGGFAVWLSCCCARTGRFS